SGVNARAGNANGPSWYATAIIAAAANAENDPTRMTLVAEMPGKECTRYGNDLPMTRAPTTVPIANPRRVRNHVAAIFIAGGYTPARKNPVANRSSSATG